MSSSAAAVNINELIYLYFCSSEEALQALIDYYRPALNRMLAASRSRWSCRSLQEDFYAEADLLLVECLEQFRDEKKKTFTGYYKKALLNHLSDGARTQGSCLYMEPEHVSLDRRVREDSDQTYLQNFPDPRDLHKDTMIRTQVASALESMRRELKEEEYQCLLWKLEGCSTRSISRRSGFSYNKVQRLLTRFRKRIGIDADALIC